jgi:hypothetical protein
MGGRVLLRADPPTRRDGLRVEWPRSRCQPKAPSPMRRLTRGRGRCPEHPMPPPHWEPAPHGEPAV